MIKSGTMTGYMILFRYIDAINKTHLWYNTTVIDKEVVRAMS
jgi:hypothetical protein